MLKAAGKVTEPELPPGVKKYSLTVRWDSRGCYAEMFRDQWMAGRNFLQWNMSISYPGVLRGMKVHLRHEDYFVLLRGRASVGLVDLRPGSPAEGKPVLFEMSGESPTGLLIVPGVAHGFIYHEWSICTIGVSRQYDISDEIRIPWDHPELKIPWPETPKIIYERAGIELPLTEVKAQIPPWRAA